MSHDERRLVAEVFHLFVKIPPTKLLMLYKDLQGITVDDGKLKYCNLLQFVFFLFALFSSDF